MALYKYCTLNCSSDKLSIYSLCYIALLAIEHHHVQLQYLQCMWKLFQDRCFKVHLGCYFRDNQLLCSCSAQLSFRSLLKEVSVGSFCLSVSCVLQVYFLSCFCTQCFSDKMFRAGICTVCIQLLIASTLMGLSRTLSLGLT